MCGMATSVMTRPGVRCLTASSASGPDAVAITCAPARVSLERMQSRSAPPDAAPCFRQASQVLPPDLRTRIASNNMAALDNTAMLVVSATLTKENQMSSSKRPGFAIQREVAALFRKAGWSVLKHDNGPDLTIRKGDKAYAVEVKRSSEGRTDRLVPLMAQAILQAQSCANTLADVEPLAIVAAPHIPLRVAHQLREFASAHAPEVAVGIMDSRGFRDFSGSDLDSLSERALPPAPHEPTLGPKVVDLFSDLNQWLIKVLLAPYLNNTGLLNAPPSHYRNYSDLARAASVSGMTAFRFLRQLRLEGFLPESTSLIPPVR